ncbi:MAG: sugar phosphate isomerase/epimerase family protein [Egibacteraceae bacterium]
MEHLGEIPPERSAQGGTGVSGLRFAYGTNGLGDHRLADVIAWLADLGYAGVALTLDHHHLDPFAGNLSQRVRAIAGQLQARGLGVVVETGARFLLDPRRKHEPTLVSDSGRERRVDLLQRACVIAAELGAPVVSCWSGAVPANVPAAVAWDRLLAGLDPVLASATRLGVRLGVEPEPGMLVDTLDRWDLLADRLGRPATLGLTLDLGHCRCLEPAPVPACVRRAAADLVHVQIEDMRRGLHEHLYFGEGEMEFPPILAALREIAYRGLVAVELTRHSHAADRTVPGALAFLRAAERQEVAT